MWAAAKQTEKVQTGARAEVDPRLRDGSHLLDRVTPSHAPAPSHVAVPVGVVHGIAVRDGAAGVGLDRAVRGGLCWCVLLIDLVVAAYSRHGWSKRLD